MSATSKTDSLDSFVAGLFMVVGVLCSLATFMLVMMAACHHSGWVIGVGLGWVAAFPAAICAFFLGPIALLVAAFLLVKSPGTLDAPLLFILTHTGYFA